MTFNYNSTGCLVPVLSDLSCAGHGTCVNGTFCVCDDGWSSIAHWFDATGLSCVVNDATVLVLDWIAWSLMAALILVLLSWFIRRGRPFLVCRTVPDDKRFTERHPQEVMLVVLASLVFMFIFQTLSLAGLRMINSTACTVVFSVLPIVWQLSTIATTGWQAYIAVHLLRGLRTPFDSSRGARNIVLVLGVIGSIESALWIACIVALRVYGSFGSQAFYTQIALARIFYAVMLAEIVLHVVPLILSIRFLRGVNMLAVKSDSTHARSTKLATQRLKTHMLGYLAGLTYLIHLAVQVQPAILSYWIAVMFIIGAPLCAMAFLLFFNMGATARIMRGEQSQSISSGSLQGAAAALTPPVDPIVK
jgi:hypothetical protein